MHPCTFFAAPSKEKQGNATNHQTLSSSAFSPFFLRPEFLSDESARA
jgi:hypothetical protein